MVKGLDIFREYFAGFEDQYVLIGGAACDILFASNAGQFRATRDLDIVLIVESLTKAFGERLWEFIKSGNYQNKAAFDYNLLKNYGLHHKDVVERLRSTVLV